MPRHKARRTREAVRLRRLGRVNRVALLVETGQRVYLCPEGRPGGPVRTTGLVIRPAIRAPRGAFVKSEGSTGRRQSSRPPDLEVTLAERTIAAGSISLIMSYTVRAAMATAVSASISTSAGPVVAASDWILITPAARSGAALTNRSVRGMG